MKELKELIKEEFEKDNYLVISNDFSQDNLAVVYFSSFGVYTPDEADVFINKIVEKNNFEWFKLRIKNAKKHIYVRDITKNWYLDGINSKLNSPDRVVEFLKKETAGMKVITVGSSSGGFAAILFGMLLGADKVFAFSPQVDLSFYQQSVMDKKYSNLISLIENSDVPVYFVLPTSVEQDIIQWNLVRNFKNVHSLQIVSTLHGVPFSKILTEFVLHLNEKRLKRLFSKNKPVKKSYLRILFWMYKIFPFL